MNRELHEVTVTLARTGVGGSVVVDGHDISSMVSHIRIDAGPGDITVVEVSLIADVVKVSALAEVIGRRDVEMTK